MYFFFLLIIWIPFLYGTHLVIKTKEDDFGPYCTKVTLYERTISHENIEYAVSAKVYKDRSPRFTQQVKNRYRPYIQDTSCIKKMAPKKAFFSLLQNLKTSSELEKAVSAMQTFDTSACAHDITIAMLEKEECKKRNLIAAQSEQTYGLIHHNAVIDWSFNNNPFLNIR